MSLPPADSTAATRSAARRFLADLREAVSVVGTSGSVSAPVLVHRVADEATRKARDWPTRSGRHRFLVELSGEARNEWRVQTDPNGIAAQFYDALSKKLDEMAEAVRA